MSLYENPDGPDAADRVCAWAGKLEELGRRDEAREVLERALDQPGSSGCLALTLAGLETRAGDVDRAADVLRKVLGDDPDNTRAVYLLAKTLLDAGRAHEAARVLPGAGGGAGKAAGREFAELAGEICRARGRHAQAVVAFGPRSSLSPRGRRLRRASWWRSGGPLRHRSGRGRVVAPPGVVSAGTSARLPDPPDVELEAIAWAERLSSQHRHDDARRVVSEALATHGRHGALLACAARIEDAADAGNTALYLWREVYREAPGDVEVACGLAMRLVLTVVTPSYTRRTSDALRILDGFPDQDHPKIRTTRAEVLRWFNNAPAARVVAAYGAPAGLPRHAVRARRRLWWRSAGPLGQLGVRVADLRRGARRTYTEPDPASRTEAESEAVARVLDAIRPLPSSAARQRLEEALHAHGRRPSLLLAYANVDADSVEQARWHRLAMAAEAARYSPDSPDAVCSLAMALDTVYDYGTALQVLESLPSAARRTVPARITAGDLHYYAGNFALAAAAYGCPRDLDRYDRRRRRRYVRRALTQRLRPAVRGDVEAVDPASVHPVPHAIAQVLDRGALLIDEPAKVRELYRSAIGEHGRHPRLLLALADAERRFGGDHICAALAVEAMHSAPADPLIIADGIEALWLADCDADALRAIRDLPEQLKNAPAVRGIMGQIYWYWHMWAHAVTAFGRGGLTVRQWRTRRACWWRSGGPLGRIRSTTQFQESTLLSALAPRVWQQAALPTLNLPAPLADAARSDLATYRMASAYLTVLVRGRRVAWLRRVYGPASIAAVLGALVLAERLHYPSAGTTRALTMASLATAAQAAAMGLVGRYARRTVKRLIVAVACAAASVILLRIVGQAAFVAGLAFAALACVIVAECGLGRVVAFTCRVQTARWQRREAETGALSALLDLLGMVIEPGQRRDAEARRRWMADLEHVAAVIERDLPHTLESDDPSTRGPVAGRARSAANTLRELKLTAALPGGTSRQRLIECLTELATALALHDFEAWPPALSEATAPGPTRPAVWRRAASTARTALAIFVPPLVAYLLPRADPAGGTALSWLRLATVVWALVGIGITLEPGLTDRIVKMALDFIPGSPARSKDAREDASTRPPANTDRQSHNQRSGARA